PLLQPIEINEDLSSEPQKADIGKTAKADTPLKEDIYIYLLSQFEKFWSLYPEKKSKHQAWQVFQTLTPDNTLFNTMLNALEAQIQNHNEKQANGQWVPPWKFPANWLTEQRWEDELNLSKKQEKTDAKPRKNTRNEPNKDLFWDDCAAEDEEPSNNIIPFQRCQ
ncbi:MAG: hypothetical protein Q8R79_02025, partial [Legionellaceae bacterium]|nr:hypothetical protein [Legionellaceae bacterium]